MYQETIFNINYWSTPLIDNFKTKKKQILHLLKSYPEKKQKFQNFYTNRKSDRTGLSEQFYQICKEEIDKLSVMIKKNIQIEDIWSVTYKKGDYHLPHNHGSIGLTGILYLQLEEDSPRTFYIQPWNDIYNDATIYNATIIQEGSMVVIPKFIKHFTTPNESQKIKRVIAWDMKCI